VEANAAEPNAVEARVERDAQVGEDEHGSESAHAHGNEDAHVQAVLYESHGGLDVLKRARISSLREGMNALATKLTRERGRERESNSAPSSSLPGEFFSSPFGPLRRVVTHYPEDHRHGATSVQPALAACPQALSILALDPTLSCVDFSRALYIDTETTGLLGGTGTLPFLIGCARFEAGCLVVEQLLLERPGLEAPMLSRLGELLADASCIVSFNGKSFDWPLLRTRFIMNRVPAPKVPAHLDLLHCARRVYKRRLGSVRLIQLEEAVLGFERVDDMPGELIPETYLGFLRGRISGAALWPIVAHNRSDLVALPAMLGELVRRFTEPAPASSQEREQDARDQLGFARVAARADDRQRALAFAESAAEADLRGELSPEAMYLAGVLKLKAGDLEGALQAFNASLAAACGRAEASAPAHLALAKMFEHRLKDPERACIHAAHTGPVEGPEASARRVSRLQRKSSRETRQGSM
jgi:uncharacterized protein YprB with RNaseH-like and TPR domain